MTAAYQTTLLRLRDVMEGDEPEYDRNFRVPTAASFRRMAELVHGAQQVLGAEFPSAVFRPVGDGGLYALWRGPRRLVRLCVAADPEQSYLFHSYRSPDGEYGTCDLSLPALVDWLRWALESVPSASLVS